MLCLMLSSLVFAADPYVGAEPFELSENPEVGYRATVEEESTPEAWVEPLERCSLQDTPVLSAPVRFAAIGDTPYHAETEVELQEAGENMGWLGMDFVVHVGDIWSGGFECNPTAYTSRKTLFQNAYAGVDFLYVPGDNELNDCHEPNEVPLSTDAAYGFIQTHLIGGTLQAQSIGTQTVVRQPGRLENAHWQVGDVQFVALNLPGGAHSLFDGALTIGALRQDATSWLTAAFAATSTSTSAFVLFMHSDPKATHPAFYADLVTLATTFQRPVLVVHGDNHKTRFDDYNEATADIRRLEVMFEDPDWTSSRWGPISDWVEVEVQPGANNPFVLRNHVVGELQVGRHQMNRDASGAVVLGAPGDELGTVLASGDFNGDGHDEVAIGLPGRGQNAGAVLLTSNATDAGAENYGPTSGVLIQQGQGGVWGYPEVGDRFGQALASGDFNGDGFDDLAIGAPGEAPGADPAGGVVHLMYGSATGLTGGMFYRQGDPMIEGGTESGDQFGAALAAGDLMGDTKDELVVGVPGEAPFGHAAGGAIQVLSHDAVGVVAGPLFYQSEAGLYGWPESGDGFGSALAVGDFDGLHKSDIAIGIPGEAPGAWQAGGAVALMYATAQGGLAGDWTLLAQGSGLSGVAETGDLLGQALAAGDLDGDGIDDLAIGAPGEDPFDYGQGGAIHLLYGGVPMRDGTIRYQGDGGFAGWPELDDAFGAALAIGHLNDDSYADLVVGAPGEAPFGDPNGGAIHVAKGNSCGIGSGPIYYAEGNDNGDHLVGGHVESADRFGAALVVADLNPEPNGELLVGHPGEDTSEGAFTLILGNDIP